MARDSSTVTAPATTAPAEFPAGAPAAGDANKPTKMSAAIAVRLAPAEMLMAATVGCWRHIQCLVRQSKPLRGSFKYGNAPQDSWGADIEAAMAEKAVAKAINRYWTGINTRAMDVGVGIGVRHTVHRQGHLLIYQDDPDEVAMYLVTGTAPVFYVVGWFRVGKAKDPKYQSADRPTTYWIPQSDLNPPRSAEKEKSA